MDLGSILLILALIFAVAAFVARPLFERATKSAENTAPTSLDGLAAQRESILIELRDLDFEHSTGKMSDDEYTVQRYRLVTKGAEILQALDNAQGAVPAAVEDEIEQMIAARRKGQGKTPAAVAVAACPKCGQSVLPQDKFCAHCGAKLAAVY
jgi:hypothetical protein